MKYSTGFELMKKELLCVSVLQPAKLISEALGQRGHQTLVSTVFPSHTTASPICR